MLHLYFCEVAWGEKTREMQSIQLVKFSSNSRHSLLFLLGGEENIACALGFCCSSVLIRPEVQELCHFLELPMAKVNTRKVLGEQVKSLCREYLIFQ